MNTTEQPFCLPELGESYINLILERCHKLVETDVWEGIEKVRLETWLNNFQTVDEQYFAAVVLDALIYRSPAQTQAMFVQLFQRTLPDLSRSMNLPMGPIEDWVTLLRSPRSDPGIRLVPVIPQHAPPSKSGPVVCRLLKRHMQINEKWLLWPDKIHRALNKGIKVFLFVDDFLGTGSQFRKFSRPLQLQQHSQKATLIYAPLVAHAKGLQRLMKRFPFMGFAAVEYLDEQHSLFSDTSGFFRDGTNCAKSGLRFYWDLLRSRQLNPLDSSVLGYGRLGLAYAFHHAAPNASLPILWVRTDRWQPLFDR